MADSTGRTAALGLVDQRRLWAVYVDLIVAFQNKNISYRQTAG